MSPEKKAKIQRVRARLAALSEKDKAALIDRGLVATIEGRVLSPCNTLLVYSQLAGREPTVVGGYRQWIAAGRQVARGEVGAVIWLPLGSKDENGEIKDVERFFTATVFDVSQTIINQRREKCRQKSEQKQ